MHEISHAMMARRDLRKLHQGKSMIFFSTAQILAWKSQTHIAQKYKKH